MRFKTCLTFLLLYIGYVFADITQGSAWVTLNINDKQVTLTMDEYNDAKETVLFRSDKTIQFKFEYEQFSANWTHDDDGLYSYVTNDAFNFEDATKRLFPFKPSDDNQYDFFVLNIQNIEDENPTVSIGSCEMEENTGYNADHPDVCHFTVFDADGMNMDLIKFSTDFDDTFKFMYKTPPSSIAYQAEGIITTVKTLDYETKNMYLVKVTAKDNGNNEGSATVIIKVVDLPDMPPVWDKIIYFEEVEEESEKSFAIAARDGDAQYNSPITFELTSGTEYCTLENPTDNSVDLKLNKIDRDKNDLTSIVVNLKASDDTNDSISRDIMFYITDIDDNSPLITLKDNNQEMQCGDQTYSVVPETSSRSDITIQVCENYNSKLPLEITVSDIDTGTNAQYEVNLDRTEFQIIPPEGYKEISFEITVIDESILDYERDKKNPDKLNQDDIVITMNSKGKSGNQLTDQKTITIVLIDYNDEAPIFKETSYKFEVDETVEKGANIGTVTATDYDEGDKITYSIEGTISSTLDINDNGEITVKKDNAFDYDIIPNYQFQIKATDEAKHQTSVMCTLSLTDVNNKPPTISVSSIVRIAENQKLGTILEITITVSSTFDGAELNAELDWENSRIMKNSVQLALTDDMKCVNLITPPSTKQGEMEYTLQINKDDTPDYELFDRMYLMLRAVNTNFDPKFPNAQYSTAMIDITVTDVNDNPPEFTNNTLTANRTVIDTAQSGTYVGIITAEDRDAGTTLYYSIKTLDGPNFDWIQVDTLEGSLSVSNTIDCDADKIDYLKYQIIVHDEEDPTLGYSDEQEISIYIIDKNDNQPELADISGVSVEEKSDGEFYEIEYTDNDRDVEYHSVQCKIQSGDCDNMFKINYENGKNMLAIKDSKAVDRDTYGDTVNCAIVCEDNPQHENGEPSFSVSKTFDITLEDINDHTPEIKEKESSTYENTKEGVEIATIQAEDPDKDDNGEVEFKLVRVIDELDQPCEDLFDLTTADSKKGILTAHKDLQGYYGKYIINMDVSDKGTPPNVGNLNYTLSVEKYNFNPPSFIFPESNGQHVDLNAEQTVGAQLIKSNMEGLENLKASTYTDKDCDKKWDITFKITDGDDKYFYIKKLPTCEAQLQITEDYEPVNLAVYKLTIEATINAGRDPIDGEASFTSTSVLDIKFITIDEPFFEDPVLVNFDVREDDDTWEGKTLDSATYGVDSDDTIYYYIVPSNDYFNVTVNSKDIALILSGVKILFVEHESFVFDIVCTKDSNSPPANPKANSKKPMVINITDINNNPPVFERESYFAAVTLQYKQDPVITVAATDIDTVKNQLTYSISDIKCFINLDQECPFEIRTDTGAVSQKFELQSNMEGYFTFKVTVKDEPDDITGIYYNATTDVTILIITSDDILEFRFENTATEVIANSEEMLKRTEQVLGYVCDKINVAEEQSTGITKVQMYFLDGNTAKLAADVLKKISDISTFRSLRLSLREVDLNLMSFPADASEEDLTAILRAWLIGVSVVLGVLCLVLGVVFFLKTRSLKSRISRLTNNQFDSDESINKRGAVNAPNTNQNAVEGQNPIFNIEKEKTVDAVSITSGDSDLIGLEDNGDFDIVKEKVYDGYM